MKWIFMSLLLLINLSVQGQLPHTNLFAFAMKRENDSFSFSQPRFLTAFNSRGYNNQPFFWNNNELFVTIGSQNDTTQTDIYSLNLLTETLSKVTETAESEYSGTLTPDREYISCIRVDAGRKQVQRLWKYPVDRSDEGKAVLTYINDVGYHCWVDDTTVALFIVAAPDNYLLLAHTTDESTIKLNSSIGRCMQLKPDGRISFVHKINEKTWFIKELNPKTLSSDVVKETLPGSEDFALLPDGTLLMGQGSKLYKYRAGVDQQWVEVADFKFYNIYNIKRIAISRENDKIVLVNEE